MMTLLIEKTRLTAGFFFSKLDTIMDTKLEALGLYLFLDFISVEEEQELLKYMPSVPAKKTKGRNNIQRFGSELPYKSSMLSKIIPDHFNLILDRIEGLGCQRPDSVSINEYLSGQAITKHIDSKSSGPIISVLSMLSDAVMVFSKKTEESIPILLPARSLVQMKGEIRNDWHHEILPVKSTRYSVVFRVGCNHQ